MVNILLRKFTAENVFPFHVKLEKNQPAKVLYMDSSAFERACQEAVANRDPYPIADYTTLLDPDTGKLMRQYADGRVEYVLD